MITKEQFIKAMEFFEIADSLQEKLSESIGQFCDYKPIFTACYPLWDNHLVLLENAMKLNEKDNPVTDWIYEASDRIFGEPNENGISLPTGKKADHKFLTYHINGKKITINNTSELYDFIVDINNSSNK